MQLPRHEKHATATATDCSSRTLSTPREDDRQAKLRARAGDTPNRMCLGVDTDRDTRKALDDANVLKDEQKRKRSRRLGAQEARPGECLQVRNSRSRQASVDVRAPLDNRPRRASGELAAASSQTGSRQQFI